MLLASFKIGTFFYILLRIVIAHNFHYHAQRPHVDPQRLQPVLQEVWEQGSRTLGIQARVRARGRRCYYPHRLNLLYSAVVLLPLIS